MAVVLTVNEGDAIGLSRRQVTVVNLLGQGSSREHIAETLGVSKQTARDLIGGLCDYYDCRAADVAEAVRQEIAGRLSVTRSEISEH